MANVKPVRIQTPAQRRASERNLPKGNPRAYGKQAVEPDPETPPTPDPIPDKKSRTYRAKAAKPAKAPTVPKRAKSKRATSRPPDPAPPAPKSGQGSGFLGGILDGIRGG